MLGGQYNDVIKNEDGQKSIELNDEDPNNLKSIENLLNRLENFEMSFRYCRLCECILKNEPEAEQLLTESSIPHDEIEPAEESTPQQSYDHTTI